MVGVRASNRCDNCRIRKRKCLGQIPACSECIRSGWECPGYKAQWKFIDEAPRMTKYYSTRKYVYDVDPESEEGYSQYSDDDAMVGEIVWENVPYRNSSNTKIVKRRGKVEVPRFNGFDLLGSTLVYCLNSKVNGALVPLGLVGAHLEFIPARLGLNPALDDAVNCVCVIYSNANPTPYNLRRDLCQSYVRAIASLRRCLNNNSTRMESETLCASLLLQLCELVINDDDGKWDHLARGSALLLHARGVQRYKNPFDLAMLESQLGFLFRQSTRFKEHCFLRDPEWQALLRQGPTWPYHSTQPASMGLRTRLCGSIIVEFSSLLMECAEVGSNGRAYLPGWEEQADMLIEKAFRVFEEVREWLTAEAEPLFLSYTTQQGIIQGHIHYPDVLSAVMDSVALTALLTLHKILCFLCYALVGAGGQPRPKQLEIRQRLDRPDVVERRLQRAVAAFEFVKRESTLAAKPLEFGLKYIQSNSRNAPGSEIKPVKG